MKNLELKKLIKEEVKNILNEAELNSKADRFFDLMILIQKKWTVDGKENVKDLLIKSGIIPPYSKMTQLINDLNKLKG